MSSETPSPLEDRRIASHAWARYRRMMRWTTGVALLTTAAGMAVLYSLYGMPSIHLYIAAAGGMFAMVMLTAALMGLVFLSSGSGHDDCISDRLEEERNRP